MSVRPLSPALRKKAEEELNETPTRIAQDIKTLRDWLQGQEHLRSIEAPDQWLVAFLRGCKYNMEKTKDKIKMYYKLKNDLPQFYGNRDPLDPGIQELLKLGVILPLKNCINDGAPRILLSRFGVCSALERPLADIVKVILMIIEILFLEDDNFVISGEDSIVETQGISLSLLWQWTPRMAKNVFSCIQNGLVVRIKSIHLVDPPLYIGAAVRLFKMFVSAKLGKRIFWHSKNLDYLYRCIDKSVLPKEYGGSDGTVDELIEYWKTKVESYRYWFVNENDRSDESKSSNDDKILQ